MNSLLLGLALFAPQVAASHPRPSYPPPLPAPQLPPGPPLPILPGGPQAVMTLKEFARSFQPIPGTHSVWLVHPKTCRPVHVCFNLPPGCPKVKVHRREIKFDYGRREVEIHFRHNGTVKVDYD
jgi:hypothetical protein